jgi:hypothetical protein
MSKIEIRPAGGGFLTVPDTTRTRAGAGVMDRPRLHRLAPIPSLAEIDARVAAQERERERRKTLTTAQALAEFRAEVEAFSATNDRFLSAQPATPLPATEAKILDEAETSDAIDGHRLKIESGGARPRMLRSAFVSGTVMAFGRASALLRYDGRAGYEFFASGSIDYRSTPQLVMGHAGGGIGGALVGTFEAWILDDDQARATWRLRDDLPDQVYAQLAGARQALSVGFQTLQKPHEDVDPATGRPLWAQRSTRISHVAIVADPAYLTSILDTATV